MYGWKKKINIVLILKLFIPFLVMLVVVIILWAFVIVVKNAIVFKCVKNVFGEDELHLVIPLSMMLRNTLAMYVHNIVYFTVLDLSLIRFFLEIS